MTIPHLDKIIDFLTTHIGYPEIFTMMAIESSFFPFPSEAAMIPAGISLKTGDLNLILILAAALGGIVIGTSLNYLIGKYIGREFVLKYCKYFFIKKEVFYKSEELFKKNMILYTFLGRLIPGVRQLISIPAGMFKMPYLLFISASLLGSFIWISILIALGYIFADNQDLISKYMKEIIILILISIAIYLIGNYFFRKKLNN